MAQDITLPQLSGYKKNSKYPVYKPENLKDFNNLAAETYLAYGFADLHVADYKKGKNVIRLEIYRHGDNSLAFGIYSSERSSSGRYLNIGAQGYVAEGAVNFFKDKYYVKISTNSNNEKVIQSAESLALKVADMLKGDNKMPSQLSQFPETGKKVNEETFINENVLGHKFLNKAFKANYITGSDNFSIFIMEYKSPEETIKSVEDYLTSVRMDPPGAGSGRYMLKDGYNGTVFLAWKDNLIVIISGLSGDQSDVADRYTSEILK
jgi:hypothetical protein